MPPFNIWHRIAAGLTLLWILGAPLTLGYSQVEAAYADATELQNICYTSSEGQEELDACNHKSALMHYVMSHFSLYAESMGAAAMSAIVPWMIFFPASQLSRRTRRIPKR